MGYDSVHFDIAPCPYLRTHQRNSSLLAFYRLFLWRFWNNSAGDLYEVDKGIGGDGKRIKNIS